MGIEYTPSSVEEKESLDGKKRGYRGFTVSRSSWEEDTTFDTDIEIDVLVPTGWVQLEQNDIVVPITYTRESESVDTDQFSSAVGNNTYDPQRKYQLLEDNMYRVLGFRTEEESDTEISLTIYLEGSSGMLLACTFSTKTGDQSTGVYKITNNKTEVIQDDICGFGVVPDRILAGVLSGGEKLLLSHMV